MRRRFARVLARSNIRNPRFADFPSCVESNLTNLIGSGLNLLCLESHSNPECRWTWPEVAILGADQKERASGDENGYPRDFHVNYARFLSNVFYSFQNLGKALQTLSFKRSAQKTFLIPKFVIDTIN